MSDENKLPAERQEESRVVEAQVVDNESLEPRPSWWKRLLARAALSLLLAAMGLIVILVGAVLTVTVVGAAIGLPLLLLGVLLLILAVISAFGGGKIHVSGFPGS